MKMNENGEIDDNGDFMDGFNLPEALTLYGKIRESYAFVHAIHYFNQHCDDGDWWKK